MSIFDLFKPAVSDGKAVDNNQNNQQQQNDKQNDPNKGLSDPSKTVDSNGKMPGSGVNAENPLDVYAKLFENAAKAKPNEAPVFQLDPKVISDVASKMDFMAGADKDLMQKAATGDVSALLAVVQSVGQKAYQAAIEHNSALTDAFLNQRSSFESERVNAGVRQQLTQSSLSSAPNYDHPVVKNELNRVARQFAIANPDMAPAKIAEAAQKYISDVAGALNTTVAKTTEASVVPGDDNFDWSAYLTNTKPKAS